MTLKNRWSLQAENLSPKVVPSCCKPAFRLDDRFAFVSLGGPAQLPLFDERQERDEPTSSAQGAANKRTAEPSRHPWPYLLKRVFAVDVLACVHCGGRLRIVELATKPDDVSRILRERGWARAPPRAELPTFPGS